MAELKGSKTEKNLQAAFAGESQARNKYTYFASVAKKEGYEQIAAVFLETAEQEKEHAKLHLKALGGIGDTAANLKAAAAGEREETTAMYPTMAKDARDEGFEEIARIKGSFTLTLLNMLHARVTYPADTPPDHAAKA
jgi:rubrerythrin